MKTSRPPRPAVPDDSSSAPATGHAAEHPAVPDVPTATALKLYVVLSRALASVNRHVEASIAATGLSASEFGVLEALYNAGPMLLGEVQRKILVSSGGITFVVDRLEKRGLVERRPCETDRRARYAALTARGRELIDTAFPGHAEAIRRAMSGLGLADQRAVTTLLRTLGTEAEALPALPAGTP
jgi:MarR family 2-MHQ and catechol resistance regulon transcriptional repressor